MTTTGYRIVYTLLAVAFIGIVAASILFIPSGDPTELPAAVERYSPGDGDMVTNPVKVILDLAGNYEAQFVIDGITIPEDEVVSIVETGRHQFEPGEGKTIEQWTPGDHTVVATYIGGPNRIDVGTVVWTFRIQ